MSKKRLQELAEAAEREQDWSAAREYWYRAAEELTGNPHGLRTYYNEREDRADQKRRSQIAASTGR